MFSTREAFPSSTGNVNPQQWGHPPKIPGCTAASAYSSLHYAGIGSRFLAALIDGVVLGIPIGIISTVLSAMMAVRVINRSSRSTGMNVEAIGAFIAGFGFIMIISLLLSWAYFAMMESSAWQGTIGKKVMGIQVADLNGSRISLGRATIRLAVKSFLSSWFLIGYIMAFFTQRKQALHDLLAGTIVLVKQTYPSTFLGYPQQADYTPPPMQFCPHCGRSLHPNAQYCSNCGRNI